MASTQFENVDYSSFEKSACSPSLDEDFRGLVIAAPETVAMSDEYIFPVCGSYRVASDFYEQFQSFSNEIVVVAVDAETHTPYASTLLDPEYDPGVYDDDEPVDEDAAEPYLVAGWFNVNLFEFLEELPRKPGSFHVYAMIGDLKSNTLLVKVAPP